MASRNRREWKQRRHRYREAESGTISYLEPSQRMLVYQTSFATTAGTPEEPLTTSVVMTTSKLELPGFRSEAPSASRSRVSSVMNSLAALVPFSPSPAIASVGCWGARVTEKSNNREVRGDLGIGPIEIDEPFLCTGVVAIEDPVETVPV